VGLGHQRATAFPRGNRLASDDLDGVSTGPVPGSHVAVALGDGAVHGKVTVLPVHVVGSRSGVVSQPDPEVLDLEGVLLLDLLDGDDLSGGLLELTQLTQEVPEPGLSHDRVSGEEPLPVKGSDWLSLSRELAPDDCVLFKGSLGLHLL